MPERMWPKAGQSASSFVQRMPTTMLKAGAAARPARASMRGFDQGESRWVAADPSPRSASSTLIWQFKTKTEHAAAVGVCKSSRQDRIE